MKPLIIGTGFLGEQLYYDLKKSVDKIVVTHRTNRKFDFSYKFDFFTDSIKDTFSSEEINTIFIPAKIEFTEDQHLLKRKMVELAEWAADKRVIYISSDGIFDGEKGSYIETDPINPVTLYGRNLNICETIIREKVKNYCIIRPSYLYGFVNSKLDSRFRKTQEDVTEGKKVTRFTDMYKSPLSYKQASEYIVKLSLSDFVGTIHISGPRMSICDFTKEGMEALGLSTDTLKGEKMPLSKPVDFLSDTSLNSSLAQKLIGIIPLGIKESFETYYKERVTPKTQYL